MVQALRRRSGMLRVQRRSIAQGAHSDPNHLASELLVIGRVSPSACATDTRRLKQEGAGETCDLVRHRLCSRQVMRPSRRSWS